MLSQIGCVTIPGEILEKRLLGEALTESENEIFFKRFNMLTDSTKINSPHNDKG
ncbi:hypothetical protein Pmgp_02615 [Pelotomaculum propionicicum]|uniref:Uncharacterized protein n=1 Tax=Pelotomaculum propionicicum TaxID=258475 RepID=A0A4Y7RMQ7_9FIRM|nr:hypothetical protein Pmgp_02615 [Pelotomaculum propionicicum]